MRFQSPWMLLLFIPTIIIWVVSLYRKKPSLSYSSTTFFTKNLISWRQRLSFIPNLLRLIMLCLLVIALARPQKGNDKEKHYNKGIAIEMVLDRSTSMLREMRYGNKAVQRLDAAKAVFEHFVTGNKDSKLKGRNNDMIGLILFSKNPYTICPLTLGHDALVGFIKEVKTLDERLINEQGTAIYDALALAGARLKKISLTLNENDNEENKEKEYEIKSKAIILLTDGHNNRGDWDKDKVTNFLKDLKIKVYAVGIGNPNEVDMPTLRHIAKETNGEAYLATSVSALFKVYKEIDKLERSEIKTVRYTNYQEKVVPFLSWAIAIFMLETILRCFIFRRIP